MIRLLAGTIGPRRPCSDGGEARRRGRSSSWLQRARRRGATRGASPATPPSPRPTACCSASPLPAGCCSARRAACRPGAVRHSAGRSPRARGRPARDAACQTRSRTAQRQRVGRVRAAGLAPAAGLPLRPSGHQPLGRHFPPAVVRHLAKLARNTRPLAGARRRPCSCGACRRPRRYGVGALADSLLARCCWPSESSAESTCRARTTTPRAPPWRCSSSRNARPAARSHRGRPPVTSCEESGLLGAQAYARAHACGRPRPPSSTSTPSAGPPLTYILREGTRREPAGIGPTGTARVDRRRRPDLGLTPAARRPGLPTDATVMRARGWEAITLLAQGDTIPNYHWPTDTYENVYRRP